MIARELLLVKVSILGPEYLEEQYAGGPSHDPRKAEATKLEREAALADNFERSAGVAGAGGNSNTSAGSAHAAAEPQLPPITPSEALRLKHQHLHSLSVLSQQFGARLLDIAENSVIVELTAKTPRVEAFLSLLKPFGILESARTGVFVYIVCVRTKTDAHKPVTTRFFYRSDGDAKDPYCQDGRGRGRHC